MLNWLKSQATRFKTLPRNRDGSADGEDIINYGPANYSEHILDAHINLKFSLATPSRFLSNRKILEKLGKKLKKEEKIVYFDCIIQGGQIYLKTQWKKTQLVQTTQGLRTHFEKCYTFYSTKLATQILEGSLSIEERESENRQNKMIREQ